MPEIEYVWDELSDNVIEEYEDGVLSVSYDHEPGLYGNLLSQNRNDVTSYYHYDGRGDTVALTDDAGNVTDTKEYDAWGNVIASSGSTVTPYQFIGRQGYARDAAIQMSYVRARWFQSPRGTWTSIDPIGVQSGLTSLFAYSENCPLTSHDPSGLITSQLLPGTAVWPCYSSFPVTTIATFSLTWKIQLEKPAPCDGWYVQLVIVKSAFSECPLKWPFLDRDCCVPGGSGDPLGTDEVVILESYPVYKNEQKIQPDRWVVGRLPNFRGTIVPQCGNMDFTSKGRFFCGSDIPDLFELWKNEQGTGAGDAYPSINTTVEEIPAWWWTKARESEISSRTANFRFDCCAPSPCCPGSYARLKASDGENKVDIRV